MSKLILDLYCGAGGASMGYHRAGWKVVGVDINPQPDYPFRFHRADALEYVRDHGHLYDAIHASPPCQAYSRAQKINRNEHPDLIGPTRDALEALRLPYVIENVPGAPLIDPIELCGCMFEGLNVYRPRLFEIYRNIPAPVHRPHVQKQTKMGRPPKAGERMHVVGNFSGVEQARKAMDMPWAKRDGLREAIPPAYTEWIGRLL